MVSYMHDSSIYVCVCLYIRREWRFCMCWCHSLWGFTLILNFVAKMSLREIRQLFYKMKDHVFGRRFLSITSCTKELTDVLQDTFGTMTMDEEKFPR